jgi:hypothetical protein
MTSTSSLLTTPVAEGHERRLCKKTLLESAGSALDLLCRPHHGIDMSSTHVRLVSGRPKYGGPFIQARTVGFFRACRVGHGASDWPIDLSGWRTDANAMSRERQQVVRIDQE